MNKTEYILYRDHVIENLFTKTQQVSILFSFMINTVISPNDPLLQLEVIVHNQLSDTKCLWNKIHV